jgi:superfamily II DNA/RNA helicase
LRRGVDILVACPGRLEDLLEQCELALDNVSMVVVDEADRMADLGFLPAVRRLLDATRPDRQTLLFSATLDNDVDALIRRYQRDPSRHQVDAPAEQTGDVRHHFWQAARDERLLITAELLDAHPSTLVFCRTRHGAERLTKQLSREGIKAAAIHGSRSQPQRERALADFAAGRVRALIATDVAARGIHVDNVSCVVHFDPPTTHKDYVHRSGRTGRAGADGTVVSLVGPEQAADVRAIQKALRLPQQLDRPRTNGRKREPSQTALHAPATLGSHARSDRRSGGGRARRRTGVGTGRSRRRPARTRRDAAS